MFLCEGKFLKMSLKPRTASPTRPLKACSYGMTVFTLKDNAFLVTAGWIPTTVFLFWVVPCRPWKKQLNKYYRKVRVKNNNKESLKLHHWLVRLWRSYKPGNTQWLFQCMRTWVRQSSWPVARRRTKAVVTNQNRGGQLSPVADSFQQRHLWRKGYTCSQPDTPQTYTILFD